MPPTAPESVGPAVHVAAAPPSAGSKAAAKPVYGFMGFSEWLLITLLTKRGTKSKKLGGMEPQQIQDLLASSVPITLLVGGVELVFFHVFLRLFTRPVWMKLLVIGVIAIQQHRQAQPGYNAVPWAVPSSAASHRASPVLVLPLLASLAATAWRIPDWSAVRWPMVFEVGLVIPVFEEVIYRLLILKGVLLQRLGSLSLTSAPVSMCLAAGIESGLFASAHAGAGEEAWLVSFVAGVGLSLRYAATDSLTEVCLIHMLHNLHYCFDLQLKDTSSSWWGHIAPLLLYGGIALHSLLQITMSNLNRPQRAEAEHGS
ncbi:hypothetical protein FOL47_002278 [Perkinsus chesapeaki]|uniref:CAAX prenyl protease 2/Lysostaphin resistance protein A-like domain-containing protein n=1 Tax=Perkinsus chesapeaki TaxID=330153 RepID=A0A7J6MF39_PERCH|nr:hypothetical protein FOL47_002278 [Perkinsus chesapeaki]